MFPLQAFSTNQDLICPIRKSPERAHTHAQVTCSLINCEITMGRLAMIIIGWSIHNRKVPACFFVCHNSLYPEGSSFIFLVSSTSTSLSWSTFLAAIVYCLVQLTKSTAGKTKVIDATFPLEAVCSIFWKWWWWWWWWNVIREWCDFSNESSFRNSISSSHQVIASPKMWGPLKSPSLLLLRLLRNWVLSFPLLKG